MALNIKNPEVEALAAEVAQIAEQRLNAGRTRASKAERTRRVLENVLWPQIPAKLIGKGIPKKEQDRTLGYGRHGF